MILLHRLCKMLRKPRILAPVYSIRGFAVFHLLCIRGLILRAVSQLEAIPEEGGSWSTHNFILLYVTLRFLRFVTNRKRELYNWLAGDNSLHGNKKAACDQTECDLITIAILLWNCALVGRYIAEYVRWLRIPYYPSA